MHVSAIDEKWVIVWFPPSGDCRRNFSTEAKARTFAATEDVADWNPLMEHIIVTTQSELIPL